jgi:hypothetical protein
MPRKKYPVKPYKVALDYVELRRVYYIYSINGMTFHYDDRKWRHRRLNDPHTWAYFSKEEAIADCDILNKNIFQYGCDDDEY